MKYFYVRYEVEEECPDYVFVIKAETFKKAEKIAEDIISSDYPDNWELDDGYTMYEITAEQLLERMLIN